MSTPILYLHGFLSSPASLKATLTRDYIRHYHPELEFICPALPDYPGEAIQYCRALAGEFAPGTLRVIGSSMGGYLATLLVERWGGKAVLVNPAVSPHLLMDDLLGEHQNPYSLRRFRLLPGHAEALAGEQVSAVKEPKRYRVLLQTGDETLDYRQAEALYRGSELVIEAGGDHSFIGYERHLKGILAFLKG